MPSNTQKGLVDTVAQAVLTEAVAAKPIDEVLTTGRVAMQDKVKTRTQEILDRYQSGIQITSASIMAMTLDRSVAAVKLKAHWLNLSLRLKVKGK